jgi:diaminopimelate decarboxylase
MSSNYNTRPRAPEVLVEGGRFAVVRDRETPEDLLRGEHLAPAWRAAGGAGA